MKKPTPRRFYKRRIDRWHSDILSPAGVLVIGWVKRPDLACSVSLYRLCVQKIEGRRLPGDPPAEKIMFDLFPEQVSRLLAKHLLEGT